MDGEDSLTAGDTSWGGEAWRRPQSLVLSFCGAYMLERPGEFVNSGDLVALLGRAGIHDRAARSTVNRMVDRALLVRQRAGRRTYLGLAPYGRSVLQNGHARIRHGILVSQDGAIGRRWDGLWTLLGFSVPETRRTDRHLLRSRLLWEGFGRLQDGLWIAAHAVDLNELTRGLDLGGHVRTFRATLAQPPDHAEMVREAWNLPVIAAGYEEFIRRWEHGDTIPEGADILARHLTMVTDWLAVIGLDPRLPLEFLPADWPAVRAQQLFSRVRAAVAPMARNIAVTKMDWRKFGEHAPDINGREPILAAPPNAARS